MNYRVYYLKISDDTDNINIEEYAQDPNNIVVDDYPQKNVTMTEVLLENLDVYRYYSIVVIAVGIADSGAQLNGFPREVIQRTYSDFPLEPPDPLLLFGESQTTITVVLPDYSYIDTGKVM